MSHAQTLVQRAEDAVRRTVQSAGRQATRAPRALSRRATPRSARHRLQRLAAPPDPDRGGRRKGLHGSLGRAHLTPPRHRVAHLAREAGQHLRRALHREWTLVARFFNAFSARLRHSTQALFGHTVRSSRPPSRVGAPTQAPTSMGNSAMGNSATARGATGKSKAAPHLSLRRHHVDAHHTTTGSIFERRSGSAPPAPPTPDHGARAEAEGLPSPAGVHEPALTRAGYMSADARFVAKQRQIGRSHLMRARGHDRSTDRINQGKRDHRGDRTPGDGNPS